MKPIEIHIEGYKILITKEEENEDTITTKEEKITIPVYPDYPIYPSAGNWWKEPYYIWSIDNISNSTSPTLNFHPVYDTMIGKKE